MFGPPQPGSNFRFTPSTANRTMSRRFAQCGSQGGWTRWCDNRVMQLKRKCYSSSTRSVTTQRTQLALRWCSWRRRRRQTTRWGQQRQTRARDMQWHTLGGGLGRPSHGLLSREPSRIAIAPGILAHSHQHVGPALRTITCRDMPTGGHRQLSIVGPTAAAIPRLLAGSKCRSQELVEIAAYKAFLHQNDEQNVGKEQEYGPSSHQVLRCHTQRTCMVVNIYYNLFTDLAAVGSRSMASARCDICRQHMLLHNQTQRQQPAASSGHSAESDRPAAVEAASQMPPAACPTCTPTCKDECQQLICLSIVHLPHVCLYMPPLLRVVIHQPLAACPASSFGPAGCPGTPSGSGGKCGP